MMDWGQRNRLSRVIQPGDGHTLMLAVDHGYFLGPTTRLEDPAKTVAPLIEWADALMLTRGVLRNCIDPDWNIPVVLRVSGGSTIIGENLANETLTTSLEEALRLNVSGVAMSIFVGSPYEHQTLANLADLVDEANSVGVPVLAVTAVGKELGKRDARYLALACRVAAELGAHFVKTYYCEGFEKVVGGCPVPIVVAGGPRTGNELDPLQLAYHALQAGAVGVDMGRHIWQSDHPVAMIKAVRAVIHENRTAEEAFALLQELKDAETNPDG